MGERDFAGIDPIIVCGEVGRHKHVLSEPARKFAVGAFRTERQIVFEGPFVRNKGLHGLAVELGVFRCPVKPPAGPSAAAAGWSPRVSHSAPTMYAPRLSTGAASQKANSGMPANSP